MLDRIPSRGGTSSRRAFCLAAAALLAMAAPARAEEPLTQQLTRWLDEPGVRVVAVEVYSDYCEPCKAAAPRWERLRQRYADRGLKLVVINVDPYEGDTRQCKSLPWNPDLLKCAPDLAAQLGVCPGGRCSVPQAFVWSWQGNLLVQGKTHIAEVEQALAKYFDTKNPRVLVEAVGPKGAANPKVRRLIEAALATHDKLTVVADVAEQARLRKLRKDSHDLSRREDQQCEPGQEMSANMRLLAQDFGDTMSLSLQDIESGTCGTTVIADWNRKRAAKSANKGVYKLLGRLRRRPPQMPGGRSLAPTRIEETTIDEGAGQDWTPDGGGGAMALVRFESEPPGAMVTLDGKPLCNKTPCQKAVAAGAHAVGMALTEYLPRTERVDLQSGQPVQWELVPDFGLITVTSVPSGLPVSLDGQRLGATPLTDRRVTTGAHELVLDDGCHYRVIESFGIERGASKSFPLAPKARPAGCGCWRATTPATTSRPP